MTHVVSDNVLCSLFVFYHYIHLIFICVIFHYPIEYLYIFYIYQTSCYSSPVEHQYVIWPVLFFDIFRPSTKDIIICSGDIRCYSRLILFINIFILSNIFTQMYSFNGVLCYLVYFCF